MKSLQKEFWLRAVLIKLSNVGIIDCVLLNGVVGLRIRCVVFVVDRFGIEVLIWDGGFGEAIAFSVYPFDRCFSVPFL